MRPKRSSPSGVVYSPQARRTTILSLILLRLESGGTCVESKKPSGSLPLRVTTSRPSVPEAKRYPEGVLPKTRLSNRSTWAWMRRLSEIWTSGLNRRRRLALAWVSLSHQYKFLASVLSEPESVSAPEHKRGPTYSGP